MIWVAMITGSMPLSGRAPCAPLPVMWMSNRPPPAICGPGADGELADIELGPVVHAEDLLARELLEQPVLDHRLGAAAALLGRLEDEVHGAVEVARRRRGTWRRPAAWWCGRHGRRHACGPCAGCDDRRCCARPSAARPCRRAARSPCGLLPTRMVPTTPVLPMPVVTSTAPFLAASRRRCGWSAPPRSPARDGRGCRGGWRSARPRRRRSWARCSWHLFRPPAGRRHYTPKFVAMHVRIEVAAVRQHVGPRAPGSAYQFLGEIERRHHVVAGDDRQRRRAAPSAAGRAGRARRSRRCATARSPGTGMVSLALASIAASSASWSRIQDGEFSASALPFW